MHHQFLIQFILLFAVGGFGIARGDYPLLAKYFPRGTEIGVSIDDLKATRPSAIESTVALLPRIGSSPSDRVEFIERTSSSFYLYLFKDGKLGGIIRSEPNDLNESSQLRLDEIRTFLRSNLVYAETEMIARANASLHYSPVSAQLWEEPSTGIMAYFIATSEETTIIAFEPSVFEGRNFFVSADDLHQFESGAAAIRQISQRGAGSTALPLSDRLENDKPPTTRNSSNEEPGIRPDPSRNAEGENRGDIPRQKDDGANMESTESTVRAPFGARTILLIVAGTLAFVYILLRR